VEEAKSPVVSVRDADLYATSFKLENGVEIKDRVFCVGFNKTGTRSLLNSFEILDLGPVASCNMKLTQGIFETGSYEEALRYARDYRSFKDRPWNVWDMYIHLDERFPGSYFILTVREPESWWRSVDRWITVQKPSMGSIYRKHLRSSSPSKESMIEAYLRHNREITEYFDGRDCFLVMNLEEGDGWEKLCPFLDLPIPDFPFPHSNRQNYRLPETFLPVIRRLGEILDRIRVGKGRWLWKMRRPRDSDA
jgi:hypothetical protein